MGATALISSSLYPKRDCDSKNFTNPPEDKTNLKKKLKSVRRRGGVAWLFLAGAWACALLLPAEGSYSEHSSLVGTNFALLGLPRAAAAAAATATAKACSLVPPFPSDRATTQPNKQLRRSSSRVRTTAFGINTVQTERRRRTG